MTLDEIIDRINAEIQKVPQNEWSRKLQGKTSFLMGLLRQEMVKSDEAKAALEKYHMDAQIVWDHGTTVPSLSIYVRLAESSPYDIIKHRFSSGSRLFISFKRKKLQTQRHATVMMADRAMLNEFGTKGNITVETYYEKRFRVIQKACEEAVHAVKSIDLLISTFGHEKAEELVRNIKYLDSNTGLNFSDPPSAKSYEALWYQSVFNDATRKKILALDTPNQDRLSTLSDLATDILLDATDYIGNQPEQFSASRSDISVMKSSTGFHTELQKAVDLWAEDCAADGVAAQMTQAQAARFVWNLYALYTTGS